MPIAFSPFGQVETGLNRKYNGVGLGLPLTKRLVELHGGTVTAESPGENLGATFTIVLPVSLELEDETNLGEPAASAENGGAAAPSAERRATTTEAAGACL